MNRDCFKYPFLFPCFCLPVFLLPLLQLGSSGFLLIHTPAFSIHALLFVFALYCFVSRFWSSCLPGVRNPVLFRNSFFCAPDIRVDFAFLVSFWFLSLLLLLLFCFYPPFFYLFNSQIHVSLSPSLAQCISGVNERKSGQIAFEAMFPPSSLFLSSFLLYCVGSYLGSYFNYFSFLPSLFFLLHVR